MKTVTVFALIIIVSVLSAGIYGILHDQVTYTISPEYYTRFKFIQFQLATEETSIENPRILVSLTGWMATWWVGLIIGIITSASTLKIRSKKLRLFTALHAVFIVLGITMIAGTTGYIVGYFFIHGAPESYFIPDNLTDVRSFVTVGTIHNFGYLGAVAGLFISQLYIWKRKRLYNQ